MKIEHDIIKVIPLVDIEIITETLTRIGVANKREKVLYPTCYPYMAFGDLYIVHFKELFMLTRPTAYNNLTQEDIERRNSIIYCLEGWDLIRVEEPKKIEPHDSFIFVLSYKEKFEWNISHKIKIKTTNLS